MAILKLYHNWQLPYSKALLKLNKFAIPPHPQRSRVGRDSGRTEVPPSDIGFSHVLRYNQAMKQVLRVSCKLQVSPEQVAKIEATLKAFADAGEYVNQVVAPTLVNELAMQSLVYQDVRARFGLSSQLAIHAIRRVSGNRKTAKKDKKPVKAFKPTSATYDVRTFSFREKDWTVSLTMLGGRERFNLAIGNYQRGLLKEQNPKTATLSKRKDGSYYLEIYLGD